MANAETDPAPPGGEEPSEDEPESPRKGIERLLPDLIRKGLELGIERLGRTDDSLRSFIAERKLPKEIASYLLAQVEETKNGLYRVVAKEIRDFLEHTNLSDEVRRALTSLTFEIRTEVRFLPAEDGGERSKPEVKASVKLKER